MHRFLSFVYPNIDITFLCSDRFKEKGVMIKN